jgi:hypothetical protein
MKLGKDVRLLAFYRRGNALVLYLATPDGVEEVVVGEERTGRPEPDEGVADS